MTDFILLVVLIGILRFPASANPQVPFTPLWQREDVVARTHWRAAAGRKLREGGELRALHPPQLDRRIPVGLDVQ